MDPNSKIIATNLFPRFNGPRWNKRCWSNEYHWSVHLRRVSFHWMGCYGHPLRCRSSHALLLMRKLFSRHNFLLRRKHHAEQVSFMSSIENQLFFVGFFLHSAVVLPLFQAIFKFHQKQPVTINRVTISNTVFLKIHSTLHENKSYCQVDSCQARSFYHILE